MKKISPNITFREAIRSDTAYKHGIVNAPGIRELEAMQLVAVNIFEPIRNHFKVPILVSSFYRSQEVNALVGGSKTSQHCKGEAIDMDAIDSTGLTNKKIFEFIKDNLDFDQLIWEYGTRLNPAWVHCSYKKSGNRNQILYIGV